MLYFITDCDSVLMFVWLCSPTVRLLSLICCGCFLSYPCYNTNSVYFEQRAEALPLLFISSFVDRPQWFLLSTLLQRKEFFNWSQTWTFWKKIFGGRHWFPNLCFCVGHQSSCHISPSASADAVSCSHSGHIFTSWIWTLKHIVQSLWGKTCMLHLPHTFINFCYNSYFSTMSVYCILKSLVKDIFV